MRTSVHLSAAQRLQSTSDCAQSGPGFQMGCAEERFRELCGSSTEPSEPTASGEKDFDGIGPSLAGRPPSSFPLASSAGHGPLPA